MKGKNKMARTFGDFGKWMSETLFQDVWCDDFRRIPRALAWSQRAA
jgi:hypothetical protein